MSDVNKLQVGGDHYKNLDPAPWDCIIAWNLGYLDGNVIKYIARARHKNGIEDLRKAQHYLTKLIDTLEKSQQLQAQEAQTREDRDIAEVARNFQADTRAPQPSLDETRQAIQAAIPADEKPKRKPRLP
jgi:hypothetical protein